jgi:hypothetical protein
MAMACGIKQAGQPFGAYDVTGPGAALVTVMVEWCADVGVFKPGLQSVPDQVVQREAGFENLLFGWCSGAIGRSAAFSQSIPQQLDLAPL